MDEKDSKLNENAQNDEYINLSFEITFKKVFIIGISTICVCCFLFNLYFYLYDNFYNSPKKFISRIASIEDETKIANITFNQIEDVVILKAPVEVILNGISMHQQNLLVYSYNKSSHKWELKYERKFLPEFSVAMNIEPNIIEGMDAIIISQQEGSGGYLTYYVIGSSKVQQLLSNECYEPIYNGSYKIINNKFVTFREGIKNEEYYYNSNDNVFIKSTE